MPRKALGNSEGQVICLIIRFYLLCLLINCVFGVFAWRKKKKEAVDRIITLTIILHILCLVLWGGPYAFALFAAVLLGLGVCEITRPIKEKSLPWIVIALVWGTVLFLHEPLLHYSIPLFLLTSVIAFAGKKEQVRSRYYLYGLMLLVLVPCAVSLTAIYSMNYGWVIALILLLQLNDGFGYHFGKSFGKTKIFKTISPNKSLEGYLFGLIGLVAGMALLYSFIPILQGYSPAKASLLAAYLFIFGNAGDLLFSAVKRKLEIKDFGHILPGHGGILDRFDNILFAAPVLYFMLQGW